MAFRFQKRIKILPGISINLSKSGVSTSIGPRGAKVTLGHGKVRKTFGLPGTGISHTSTQNIRSKQNKTTPHPAPGMSFGRLLAWGFVALFALLFIKAIFS